MCGPIHYSPSTHPLHLLLNINVKDWLLDSFPLTPNLSLCLSEVVSIGRLTAFYVVLVPLELIPSEPPLYAYVIVLFCTLQKGSTF